MSGSFYLTHDNPDLHTLFTTGKEIETYQSIEDCIAKVRYYLAHDTEREAIAYAGRQRAISEHTWDHRFNTLLDTLKEST
jgi:spore maturation protein CgeB